MNVGDKLYLRPTIDCTLMKGNDGPYPCRVISANEKHRHFTVEFKFPGGSYRETYKEDCYGNS